jgi:riboflavin kinase/FMN adenylyltransferase
VEIVRGCPGPANPCIVTIGMYDGLHEGHQELLTLVDAEARERGVRASLMTFDPHPRAALPLPAGEAHESLTTLDHRLELIEQTGLIDTVYIVPFTESLRQMTPRAFAGDVIKRGLSAEAVVVGENFRFGHKRAGDVEMLKALGAEFRFDVAAVPLVRGGLDGAPISSTAIRELLRKGEVEAAARLAGRLHELRGEFAGTCEVRFPAGFCLPAPGQYEGMLEETTAPWAGPVLVCVEGTTSADRAPTVHVVSPNGGPPPISPGAPVSVRFLKGVA